MKGLNKKNVLPTIVAVLTLLTISGCSSMSSKVNKFKEVKATAAMYCGSEEEGVIMEMKTSTIIKCNNGSTYWFDDRNFLEKMSDKFLKL